MRVVAMVGASFIAVATAAPAAADDTSSCLEAVAKGQKLRDGHRLVEARAAFRTCSAASCPAVVQRDCLSWVTEADAAIPTIVLSAKDASGDDALDVRVSIDGSALATKLDGTALPIDPGPHTFRFEWPDATSIERHVLVEEGQKATVVSVVHPAPLSAPPVPAPAPAPAPHPGALRLTGYVTGGTGLAAVVVGGVFGGLTFAEVSSAKGACVPAGCVHNTSQAAVNDMNTARTFGNASTALLVGGGVLVGAGLVMVLVPPKKSAPTALTLGPMLAVRGGSLGLQGTF